MAYLRDILSGKKKVYKNSEVRPINVPRFKTLSLKTVFDYAHRYAPINAYLPEQQDVTDPQLDREFLFTVVNSCDSTYFPD